MSYILDALRKSEQERRKDEQPDLLAAPLPLGGSATSWNWPALLLLVNVAALAAWWMWPTPSGSITTPESRAAPTADEYTRNQLPPAQVGGSVAVREPAVATAQTRSPATARESGMPVQPTEAAFEIIAPPPPSATSYNPAAEPEAAAFADAPPASDLSISTHIYSSDPAFRSVVLNGVRLREGEQLRAGVRVIQITESGAIIDDQGQRYSIQVGRGG